MNNLDPAEINQFNAQAAQWWDPNGPMQALHAINPLRLNFIQAHTTLDQQTVLDVGCGGGILCEALCRQGAVVTGIDQAKALLKTAKLHAISESLTLTYEQADIATYANEHPQQYDIVTCMELLEHVPDPAAIVRACAQLVKPGGHVFFSTLNRNAIAYTMAVVGAEYILGLLPKGTHDYQRFIKPSELSTFARHNGLRPNAITGISYNPLSKVFTLSTNVQVNYILHTQK